MPESVRITLCPALRELLILQSRAKLRRAWKRLQSPRRAIPTALVAILMILYVIQIYIVVSLNKIESLVDIESIAPLGLLSILFLKLLGVCIDREKSGAGFRGDETHRLIGGPFRRDQVRLYRVTGHAISIAFTSVFAAIFFRFHVTSFLAALTGSYLAMLFTYLAYTLIAVAAVHVTERVYTIVRNVLCSIAVAVLGICVYRASSQGTGSVEFLRAFAAQALLLSETAMGRVLTSPFSVFTKMIVANDLLTWATWTGLGLVIIYATLQLLLRVDVMLSDRAWRREQKAFANAGPSSWRGADDQKLLQHHLQRMSQPLPWLAGSGPIIWRQLKAVTRLRVGWLLLPLGVMLAIGGYVSYNPEEGAFETIVLIVILTSMFLPGVLPFDFRGDLKGLCALKMMPLRPRSVVLGQLAVPVVLLSCFQLAALSPLILHDRQLLVTILLTMLFLIPTNTIILALENLIFLLYHYRVTDFDMQATVRRIVMLMTKFCVLFLAAVVSLIVGLCVLMVRIGVAQIPWVGETLMSIHIPLLISAQLMALFTLAVGVVATTCWAYRRFDVSEDIPL